MQQDSKRLLLHVLFVGNRLHSASFGEGNGTPLQYSCLENPMDGGAWQATVHGVAKSQTQLSNFTSLHFITGGKTVLPFLVWEVDWGEHLPRGMLGSNFRQTQVQQRAHLVSTFSQLLSAQNNPMSEWLFWGVIFCFPTHPSPTYPSIYTSIALGIPHILYPPGRVSSLEF